MKLDLTNVCVAVIILICLLLLCHTANFLYPKNRFANLPLTIPKGPAPIKYNKIVYGNQNCSDCNLVGQAEIPCKIIQSCSQPAEEEYQLSESELAVIYKVAYQQAGNEVLYRTLKKKI
jgi:hypothetical protein